MSYGVIKMTFKCTALLPYCCLGNSKQRRVVCFSRGLLCLFTPQLCCPSLFSSFGRSSGQVTLRAAL